MKRVKQSALLPGVDAQFVSILNNLREIVSGLPEIEPALSWLIRTVFAGTPQDMVEIKKLLTMPRFWKSLII